MREGLIPADSAVDRAFRTVKRDWFLPGTDLDRVYADVAVVTHRRPDGVPVSSSSQPAIVARMLQQLGVLPGHRVLEIGAGTGYNAALLGQLVGTRGTVTTIDVDPEICAAAERHLQVAGASNVSVVRGDGWAGAVGYGPFDRVEATVGVWDLSTRWVEQLEADGILVTPLWLGTGLQASVAFRRLNGGLEAVSIEPCGFMTLRGPGAGDAGYQQIGRWTVSFDEPDPTRAALLERLLRTPPHTGPAPDVPPGWFTRMALVEPDAVHLFSLGPDGPVIGRGVIDASVPGLAVIVSDPRGGNAVQVFGGGEVRGRLLRMIDAGPPLELRDLSVKAIGAGEPVHEHQPLVTLTRPNFSFVISSN
ncbi:MAG: methyltransferase domain-containing protein [Actinomycetota bacterium]|nr:methyltransferase domain-containing protein [Actinomycetota bacterium]